MNNVASGTTDIQQGSGSTTLAAPAGEPRYLVADKNYKARRSGSLLRIIGNLFIAVGLLTLLGIGGWYGYTEWNNHQDKERIVTGFGPDAFEPSTAPKPSAATPVADLPVLSLSGANKSGGTVSSILGIANKPPAQVDSSPPVRLFLPSVNIDTKVVPVGWDMIPAPGGQGMKAEWQVADFAVGHHQGSANPGQPGNVVLSGHVDYKGQVFKDLNKSKKGDEVIVYTEKGQYLYVITDMVIVKEVGVPEEQKRRNAAYMNPTADPTLTMITCWPYGIDDHRLIVIAKPYQSTVSTQSEFVLR
ncbi:MAG TPA: sortase [Chloroflexia bacterium]|nr:sortase [Chloroflexia bacterium]